MAPVNEADLDWTTIDDGEMTVRRKQLAEAAGGDDLGCSLYEVPPGERSWPYHYHTANEEAIYVLSGTGTLRLAEDTRPLAAGDYVSLPANADGGHAISNDSDEPLRYLVVSTMNEPDVTVYPDSEKFGVFVGAPPGGREARSLEGYYPMDADVEYWDGE